MQNAKLKMTNVRLLTSAATLWRVCKSKEEMVESRHGRVAQIEGMKKGFAVGLMAFVNSWINGRFHVAAGHRPALRDLGNTPSPRHLVSYLNYPNNFWLRNTNH
jgi:hypothetical protein